MKHLFNDKSERYSEEGSNLDMEIQRLVEPIIKRYVNVEYSIRDIEYIAQHAITDLCLGIVLCKEG